MDDKLRIYFYFIFGSIGGLTGWFLAACLLLGTATALEQAIFGALIGASIGVALAAYEGVLSRSLTRLFKYGSIGLMLGSSAGLIALPLTQGLYARLIGSGGTNSLGKAMIAGILCWIVFGGMIGLIEGLNKGTQSIKGFSGGVLGGVIGGGIYELARTSGVAQGASLKQQLVLAVALSILGGAIGASIAFVTLALKQAWIEVVDGKLAGRIYDVTKYVHPDPKSRKPGIIGSDEWRANIYLSGDHLVEPAHAKIGYGNGAPYLSVFPAAQKHSSTWVNGKNVNNWILNDGDRLTIGATMLVYRQKRR